MERFDRPCSRSAGRGSFFERATENAGANLVGGSNFPAYDFLIEKYENKNPSKTLINTAQRLVLIEKKRKVSFSGPARPGGPPKGSSAPKGRAEVPRRGNFRK